MRTIEISANMNTGYGQEFYYCLELWRANDLLPIRTYIAEIVYPVSKRDENSVLVSVSLRDSMLKDWFISHADVGVKQFDRLNKPDCLQALNMLGLNARKRQK